MGPVCEAPQHRAWPTCRHVQGRLSPSHQFGICFPFSMGPRDIYALVALSREVFNQAPGWRAGRGRHGELSHQGELGRRTRPPPEAAPRSVGPPWCTLGPLAPWLGLLGCDPMVLGSLPDHQMPGVPFP